MPVIDDDEFEPCIDCDEDPCVCDDLQEQAEYYSDDPDEE
jgi:hypothetical protein